MTSARATHRSAYLRRFPIDILKIDKSFVDGIDGDDAESALTHAVIRLADTLNLTPIAEGVERASQQERLLELGCELAQGYYFAVPAPYDVITEGLRSGCLRSAPCAVTAGTVWGAEQRPA